MGVVKRCVAGFLALSVVGAQAQQVSSPAFDRVAEQLQTGGNFYLVTTFEEAFEKAASQVSEYAALMASQQPLLAPMQERVTKVLSYLETTGLFAMDSFGLSTVPRADGDFDMRMFLGAEGSTDSPLMRMLLSGAPRKIEALGFVPKDAVVALADTSSLGDVWRVIDGCIRAVCTPEEQAACDAFLSKSSVALPISLEQLLSGIGEEDMFALMLSSEKVCYIPTASGPVKMPEPSFVAAFQLASPELGQTLLGLQKLGTLPVMPAAVGELTARSVLVPAPVPFPFQLTYTVSDGYLLVGSTPEVLKEAVAAKQSGEGLVSTEAFRTAFAGQPIDACSAVSYCGRRFADELRAFQTEMVSVDGGMDADAVTMLRSLLESDASGYNAVTVVNTGRGFLEQGVTSTGGGQMLGSLVAVPVAGLLAAIAVPSFIKARSTSQKNACINNLRQLDAAKEQWALEHEKGEGSEVPEAGAAEYLKGATLPNCPAGGTYHLGTIGENPTCTSPEHALTPMM